MNTRIAQSVILLLIILSFGAGAVLYPSLPERVVSHWNAAGQPDGSMGKFWGVFFFPLMMLVVFAVYLVIPKIDPLKSNIESFRRQYNAFWVSLFVFFSYVFGLTLAWNSGIFFDLAVWMLPAMAVLFWFVGVFIGKSKRNWFVGIRTPWSLSSDSVWEKTNVLGGKLFKLSALVSLLGAFIGGSAAIFFILVPIIASVFITVVYSYLEYRKESGK